MVKNTARFLLPQSLYSTVCMWQDGKKNWNGWNEESKMHKLMENWIRVTGQKVTSWDILVCVLGDGLMKRYIWSKDPKVKENSYINKNGVWSIQASKNYRLVRIYWNKYSYLKTKENKYDIEGEAYHSSSTWLPFIVVIIIIYFLSINLWTFWKFWKRNLYLI